MPDTKRSSKQPPKKPAKKAAKKKATKSTRAPKAAVKKAAASKPNKKSNNKRTYLSRQERRLQLLHCAAKIVEREGWGALSMTSLAQHAEASRQLVYQHFESLEDLLEATMIEMFRDIYHLLITQVIDVEDSFDGVMAGLIDYILAIKPGRAAAYLQVISVPYVKGQPLAEAAKRLRASANAPGTKLLAKLGLEKEGVNLEALARMLESAVWSGHLLISDGDVTKAEVKSNLLWMMHNMFGDKAA